MNQSVQSVTVSAQQWQLAIGVVLLKLYVFENHLGILKTEKFNNRLTVTVLPPTFSKQNSLNSLLIQNAHKCNN